jgi:hypothetical protein
VKEDRTAEQPRSRSRLRPHLSKLAVAVAATVGTAVVGGIVSYYLPGVLSQDSEKPVLINVEDDPNAISSFASGTQTLALPVSLRGTRPANPQLSFCSDFHPWGRMLGGVDVGSTRFRVTLQGNTSQAVLITKVGARILGRAASPDGIYVHCPTAGNASIRSLTMNLDRDQPTASEKGAGTRVFGITLKQGETEVLDISAATRDEDRTLTWTLLIAVTVNGKSETLEVQDRGQPFKTRGPPPDGSPVFEWTDTWGPRSPFA